MDCDVIVPLLYIYQTSRASMLASQKLLSKGGLGSINRRSKEEWWTMEQVEVGDKNLLAKRERFWYQRLTI